jgi:RimJ/RimL family protein N-acetyltransferase
MPYLGKPLPAWKCAQLPPLKRINGRSCFLEPLSTDHAEKLWVANSVDVQKKNWTYLPYGPFVNLEEYKSWISSVEGLPDPLYFAIIDQNTQNPVGVSSYTFVNPKYGSIEIGHLNFSPLMQRTIISSEAIILLIRNAFSIGYRRVVWRSHSLNAASISAALRYGFTFEAYFKNYSVMKGHNRNNVWFSIIDEDWPAIDEIYAKWLKQAFEGTHSSLKDMTSNINGKKCVLISWVKIHQALLEQFYLLAQFFCDNCIRQNSAILEFSSSTNWLLNAYPSSNYYLVE